MRFPGFPLSTSRNRAARPDHGKSHLTRLILVLGLIGVVASACAAPVPSRAPAVAQNDNGQSRGDRARPGQQPLRPSTEVVLEGLLLPSALVFAPDGRLFFAEVNAGRIRVARGKDLQARPFATLPVQQAAESGLLGLALDPDFAVNHLVYAYYSESDPAAPAVGLRNRVVRFTDRDGEGVELTAILDDLPVSPTGAEDAHQGGALAFGPDGKLYVSLGDTGTPALAQDPSSPAGKILRINPDGSVPPDNPFPGSPVFALGFRNPWGLAFHPRTGELYASENGNKSHDEVNLVRPGGNYGWPAIEGTGNDPRFVDPLWDAGTGEEGRHGMVGLAFYTGSLLPELQDELLFCAFKTGTMRRATLEPPKNDSIRAVSRLARECRLGLAVGPDGAVYFSSVTQIQRLVR
jgi:glucose/arabinose dehydrogenase